MKQISIALLVLTFYSCSESESINQDPAVIVEEFSYTFDDGETFETENPTMHYDSNQFATFVKYEDDEVKIRVNFRGRQEGTYGDELGIFLKYRDGSPNVVCDTYTGIVIEVDEYGEIGEAISGTFHADMCDSIGSEVSEVQGSFTVIRTE